MSSSENITFGSFEVTNQVFLTTPYSFALVNLKPLMPGHVLVCPLKRHARLTDMSSEETSDLFQTVQRVQKLLARQYLKVTNTGDSAELQESGSFNIAIQDGPEAGQTVPHVHVHVIPRPKDAGKPVEVVEEEVRAIYKGMQNEAGNVGGAFWDRQKSVREGDRPRPGGDFPDIEDSSRKARSMDEMVAEVSLYKTLLETSN
ncbi:HIT domain-containing protein [Ceratocystis lukuohia]|uniref:Bis(5'-adenosyl)-triphosphatase n=1 Tax=Ceratocystis lukuohia TaxID=2019550 RepID=A0ABR4MRE5_9PEZI